MGSQHHDLWHCWLMASYSLAVSTLHRMITVKTGSSWLGPDEGGKCDSIGLSAVCPSKVAMIRSMVVAVAWVKADRVWEWLRALSCVRQHESTKVRVEPEGFGVRNGGKKGQRDEGQRYGKYLRWLSDWGTRDKCTTTYTMSRERNVSGQIIISDRMYGEERSM